MSDFELEFDDEIQAPQENAEFSLEFDDNQPDFLKVKRDAIENAKDPINALTMVAKNILGMVGTSSLSDVSEGIGNVAYNVVGGAVKNADTIGEYVKELPKALVATGVKIGETAKNIKNIVNDKMETAELYEFQNDKASDLVPELAKGLVNEGFVTTPKMLSDMAYWVGTNMKDPTGKKSNALSETFLDISESMKNISEYMGDIDLLKSKATVLPDGSLSYGQIGNVLGHGMGQGAIMAVMARILGPKAAYGFYAGAGGADMFKQSYEKEGDVGKANTLASINAASTYMIDRWIDPLPENIASGARMTAKQVVKEVGKSAIKEPLVEGGQKTLAENLVRKIGIDAEQDLFEGVVEEMIGALGGAAAMGGGAVVSAYSAERHYQEAKERAVELGASEGEVEQYKRATLAKLQQHPEAFDTVFQQNVQKTIQEIDAFVKENGSPEEVRKAMQTKADLEEVYNRVYEQIKTKDNDKVAAAQAKVVQGVALWGAQELGISPLEYFEQRFPRIERMAYRDFARKVNEAKRAGQKVEINLYEALKNPDLLRGHRKRDTRASLTKFLQTRGGLIDAGGELRGMDADKQVKGLINNKNGNNLDDAALAAWEAGYFPQNMERPSINELLEAIDNELRGNKRFASEAEENLQQQVNDLAEELDRADIDWRNMEPKEIEMAVDAYLERQRAYLESMEEDTGDNGLAWFQRDAIDLANKINNIDAERLAFERKDINPELKGRENEVVKAVVINRFFADKKASKDIKIDDVIAKIDETVEKNENGVRVLKNSVTGETATLSNAAIKKMFDTTRNREDTQNIGGILGKECIANIKDIFDSALLIKTHDDKKHGSKNKIRRYANVIQSDGENFIVKLTIKEMADNRNELTDIEIEGNNGRDLAAYDLKVGKKDTVEGNTSVVTSEKTLPTALFNGNDIIIDDLIEFVNTYTEKTININGVKRPITNSNGDRIAKTVEGLEAFYEWFGDSKAVNEYGEPLDLFHGTGFEFDAFDGSKPIFLSDSKDVAQWFAIYGKGTVEGRNIKTVYAKISNPLVVDAKGALFGDIEFNGQRLSAEDISNYAKENGYDGVIINNVKEAGSAEILSNDYVVFNPNQIKSTSNRGTFDLNDDRIYYQGGEDVKDLYATHNMNLVGVRNALKMGGLAMPSLAMRKVSQGNINQFGDIVFVANERLATPARGIEVYDRDAWTPNLSYAVRYDLTSKARDYIREVLDRVGQSISYTSYAYNIEENLMSPQSNTMAVELYALDKGIEDTYGLYRSQEYLDWYDKHILSNAEPYLWTENASNTDMVRKAFTLDNMMKILRKQEKSGGGFIGDYIFDVFKLLNFKAQRFKNLKEVKKNKHKLVSPEEQRAALEKLNDDFLALAEDLKKDGEDYGFGDATYGLGVALIQESDDRIKYFLDMKNLQSDEKAIQKVKEFIKRMENVPTDYFEVKPRRVVEFSEFSGVIVPKGKEYDEIAEALETQHYMTVERVEKGNNEEYDQALHNIQANAGTTFFQLSAQEEENFTEMYATEGKQGVLDWINRQIQDYRDAVDEANSDAARNYLRKLRDEKIAWLREVEEFINNIDKKEETFYKPITDLRDLRIGDFIAGMGEVTDKASNQVKIKDTWYANVIIENMMANGQINLTNKPKAVERTKDKDIEKKAKKYFGTTTNFAEAGYILTDGSMLDFSGKKEGGMAGTRSYDHRQIIEAFEDSGFDVDMTDFINNGAIRYMPESNSLYLANAPTAQQMKAISHIIDMTNGEINLELINDAKDIGNSSRSYYKEFEAGTTIKNVKNVISAYYSGNISKLQTFFQEQKDMLYRDPKGAFSQRIGQRALISMFERADASTFMHETAHFFFEELKAFAKTSKKSAEMLDTINKWLGYDGVAYTEAQIEQFARGFEQYLREGKAPSNYLKILMLDPQAYPQAFQISLAHY